MVVCDHVNIYPRNIFLRRNLIKLGDFGISRLLLGTTEMASTFTGTPHYMSPEALKQSGYDSKSDIWYNYLMGTKKVSLLVRCLHFRGVLRVFVISVANISHIRSK